MANGLGLEGMQVGGRGFLNGSEEVMTTLQVIASAFAAAGAAAVLLPVDGCVLDELHYLTQ